jgi:aspartate/methionine/tyrosine aminotransferase
LISDEVYEHMVFDGALHQSAAAFRGCGARLHRLELRQDLPRDRLEVGYVAAPRRWTAEFRKVHQFNVFTVNTPVQHGLASYMADPQPYLQLPAFYQHKRDLFREGLKRTKFKLLPSEGTYFQCVDISGVSDLGEEDFCKWLTTEVGVAAIPAVRLLRQWLRPARGALLLREEGRDLGFRAGSAGQALAAQHWMEFLQNFSSSLTIALARDHALRGRADFQAQLHLVFSEEVVEQLAA